MSVTSNSKIGVQSKAKEIEQVFGACDKFQPIQLRYQEEQHDLDQGGGNRRDRLRTLRADLAANREVPQGPRCTNKKSPYRETGRGGFFIIAKVQNPKCNFGTLEAPKL